MADPHGWVAGPHRGMQDCWIPSGGNEAIYQIGKAFNFISEDHVYNIITKFIIGSGSDEAEEGRLVRASDGQKFMEIGLDGIKTKISGQYSNWRINLGNHEKKEDRRERNCITMAQP